MAPWRAGALNGGFPGSTIGAAGAGLASPRLVAVSGCCREAEACRGTGGGFGLAAGLVAAGWFGEGATPWALSVPAAVDPLGDDVRGTDATGPDGAGPAGAGVEATGVDAAGVEVTGVDAAGAEGADADPEGAEGDGAGSG